MKRYETPTLPITLRYDDGTVASDYVFDFLIFTIVNNKIRIDKRIEYSETSEGKFNVEYTQEETGSLTDGSVYEFQINIMVGEDRVVTDIKRGKVERNLYNEVIINES